MIASAVVFSFFCTLAVLGKPYEVPKLDVCGYESCPVYDPDALNVHIVPHSHDDVGWLKTVDQYYFQDVLNVISSVVVALKMNPERRFVQVETAFFAKWWEQQNDAIKNDVINLVNNGQFELINGAWSMNDEAAVHYQSTIDQFTLGLRYLEDNLGPCARPRVGWQIDPFGHSREHASLSAQLGFDSLFFARLDYRDRQTRRDKKTMDLLWRASNNLGNTSDLFTSAFMSHYSAPSGFCFDIVCNDDPIIDDEESPDYNYQKRVEDFADVARDQAGKYPTNNILVTMGDDFRYEAALNTYINLDLLISGFDKFPQTYNGVPIKVYYSTPSCYAKAVNDYVTTNNYNLEVKTDDFMPYADGPNTYWTGYFTSRAASKRYERLGNNFLQVVKQLATTAGVPYSDSKIIPLKKTMGIFQHHDAITGTEKQHVTNNYHLLHTQAIVTGNELTDEILSKIVSSATAAEDFGLESCLLSNISYCPQTQSDKFTVVVYNPLSRVVSTPINLPVGAESWTVTDPEGVSLAYQITPSIRDFSYATDAQPTSTVLSFMAADLPPLGFKVYQAENVAVKKPAIQPKDLNSVIGYEDTSIEIDDATGLLRSITMNGQTLEVSQDFLYYSSQDSSGAYIFVPTAEGTQRIASGPVATTVIDGDVYRGVVQEFSSWAKQIIKIYNDDRSYIEFDWVIGPIDISDNVGKEVISRFTTSLATDGTWYTDSNGREILERKRNFRPTYEYSDEQPVSGNYFPVNSKIVLKDDTVEFAVLTDRSEGGSSLVDGQLELMIHRACHHDDGRGVGENLNEQQYDQGIVVRGQHFVVLAPKSGETKTAAAIQRDVAQRKLLAPWSFVTNKDVSDDLKLRNWSNLVRPLPENVQILTLEPWGELPDNTLLLRLEHVLEKDEDPTLSQEVTVDLSNLFVTFTILELQETTLGGNIPLNELNRMQWPGSNTAEDASSVLSVANRLKRPAADLAITLAPMQIRTFVVTYSYN